MKITDAAKQEIYKKDPIVKKVNLDKEKSTSKTDMPTDKIDISLLREEANKAHAHLRAIVEDLLKRQGYEISQLKDLKPEDIKVDQKARDEAKQMIEPGGPLSAEKVSDRIVNFAKAISNNDPSKLEILKSAIEEGFEQAKELMGGELPELSQETYDLIQEKLALWENEG